ncbi:hypothetical protein B879_03772 [Cecembia lonarensis LW9]|uniref:Uncharacterized protein n=2 Tax=Cecembia TaxID=1187078 RepID=K1LB44_CECL9|nr:hypothetical protein B879_03772 [Cecembia lonarensis LW9]
MKNSVEWGLYEKAGFNLLHKNSKLTLDQKEVEKDSSLELVSKEKTPPGNIFIYSKVGKLIFEVENLKRQIKTIEAKKTAAKTVISPMPLKVEDKPKRRVWSWEEDPGKKSSPKGEKPLRSWEKELRKL